MPVETPSPVNERKSNMTSHTRPNNPQANDLQFRAALVDMPEPDLMRLLRRAKALRQELRLIRVSNGEAVESVLSTRHVLRAWIGELEQVLIAKRAKDTAGWLRSWDNEGGAPKSPVANAADPVPQPVVVAGFRRLRSTGLV